VLDFSIVWASLPNLLQGAVNTIAYSLASVAIGFVIGTAICAMRLGRSRLGRGVAAIYVSFFRGVPLIVQLLVAYYCLPLIGINVSSVVAAVTTLSLCTAAYLAEILRGGFLGIPNGQIEAARMLGFSRWHILRHIEVPQAVRLTLPTLVNETTMMIKASSLVSVVGVLELTRMAQNIATSSFQPLELYIAAGVIYLLCIGVVTVLGALLERGFKAEAIR
jgi:polar amino acid transport system permease protein